MLNAHKSSFTSLSVTVTQPPSLKNGSKRYTADQLSEQLSGIQVRDAGVSEQSDADIVVVVGSDFKGLATDLQH